MYIKLNDMTPPGQEKAVLSGVSYDLNTIAPFNALVVYTAWIIAFGSLFFSTVLSAYFSGNYIASLIQRICQYVGWLVPILLALSKSKTRSFLATTPWLVVILMLFVYGFIVGLFSSDDRTFWYEDLFFFLNLFGGLCLIAITPSNLRAVVLLVSAACIASALISGITNLTTGDAAMIAEGIRVTTWYSFGPSYAVIVLAAPAIALATIAKRWLLLIALMAVIGWFLYISAAVMQTWSLVIALIVVLVLGFCSVIALIAYKLTSNQKILAVALFTSIVILAILFFPISYNPLYILEEIPGIGALEARLDRVNTFTFPYRVEEATTEINALPVEGQIAGLGFGGGGWGLTQGLYPPSLHLAIFNIWLRFGLPAFTVFCSLASYAALLYFGTAFRLMFFPRASTTNKRHNETYYARLICLSGFLAWVAILSMSGGWNNYSALSLGVLWGLWCIVSHRAELASVHYV